MYVKVSVRHCILPPNGNQRLLLGPLRAVTANQSRYSDLTVMTTHVSAYLTLRSLTALPGAHPPALVHSGSDVLGCQHIHTLDCCSVTNSCNLPRF
jgi:hypothetical protein